MKRLVVVLLVAVALMVALTAFAPVALATNQTRCFASPGVIPPYGMPFGASYSTWSARWWQWILAIPQDQNPAFDFTGANAAVGQHGPVWFLAGTMEVDWTGAMNAERTCTVPWGKALFIPIVNAEMSPPEGPTMTWPELVAFASSFIDDVTTAELTVDGRAIDVTDAYRVHTTRNECRAPTYTLPEGGVYEPLGIAPGTYKFFSDGYWVMLAPLRAGMHDITLHGVAQGEWGVFETQVTYHLNVARHCRGWW